jgi:branched-subunit amino acid aminotransferase/4-amino-4-deoxychorismate lyase
MPLGTRGSGGEAQCLVRTASVAEGALPGIVRIAVLAACRELGYPVVELAPVPPPESADGDGQGEVWSEAFLCNAVRLIQPVRHMRWLPPCTRPSLDFEDAPGRFTREIAAHVVRDMTAEGSLSPPFT